MKSSCPVPTTLQWKTTTQLGTVVLPPHPITSLLMTWTVWTPSLEVMASVYWAVVVMWGALIVVSTYMLFVIQRPSR